MTFKPRHFVYGLIVCFVLIVAYLLRAVVTPFILAAGFAYLLTPVVAFLTTHVKLPRSLSIVIIYSALIGLLTTLVIFIGGSFSRESGQFVRGNQLVMKDASGAISQLPDWLAPTVSDSFESIRASLLYPQRRVTAFLPGAVNRTIGILIFLVASFYFLRDGKKFIDWFLGFLPKKIAHELTMVALKINVVLGNYLRGQLLLVAIMSVVTYLGLTIIGVRYALILAVFTGFAEIIPIFGPIVAAAVAMLVAFTDQFSRFNQLPFFDLISVGILYFVLRQLEDLFIIPTVLSRLTKLHPLMVMFAVLVGGHVFGLIGYLAAVPVVASLKVVIDHVKALQDS